MSEPLVSVVTPTYNRANFLPTAISTVRNQTYENVEHVIVDDASTTSAREVITEEDGVRIFRHEENQGANAARNTGIQHSNGDYVAFLDDDDEWEPTKIERQVNRASETDAGIVYTGIREEEEGEIYKTRIPDIEGDITKELLVGAPLPSTSVILVDREVFEEAGTFDEQLPNHQDWEFYIRASQITDYAAVTEPLVTRHHHDEQISDDYVSKSEVTVPRMLAKHEDLASDYGVEDEFEAILELTLGETAVRAGKYHDAHRNYRRSTLLNPNFASASRTVATVFGKWSFYPAKVTSQLLK